MRYVLIFALFAASEAAVDCQDCLNVLPILKSWCLERQTCGLLIQLGCKELIRNIDDCPPRTTTTTTTEFPQTPVYNLTQYSDRFARVVALPYIAATFSSNPATCLANQITTTTVEETFTADCPNTTTCSAYIAVDNFQKAIVVSFHGYTMETNLNLPRVNFTNATFWTGQVGDYYQKGVMALWDNGLQTKLEALKTANQDYRLWVFGHNIGASLASVFASYVMYTQLFYWDRFTLVTFGQPRTGDQTFANWHAGRFDNSYRVVHRDDLYTSLPIFEPTMVGYWHHPKEIWYDNDMAKGDPYSTCTLENDKDTCIPLHASGSLMDHRIYFQKNLLDWGHDGCPNN